MKTVLNAGANANIQNKDDYLPLHLAVINGKCEQAKLLIPVTKNLNLKESHYGNTPLHIAAKNGDLESFKALIEAGADINIENNNGAKPVDFAVQYGQTDLLNFALTKNLTTKKELKLAVANREASLVNAAPDEAKVYYCGHSGWVVSTNNCYLIFDYFSANKLSNNPGLVNGTINPEELKGKKVYIFVSHDHGDHFDETIFSWKDKLKDITYIYGFKPENSKRYKKEAYDGPDYVYIENNQTQKVDNATITTLKSNDTGQGFLVEVDGISIYHPGDHALFTSDDKPGFVKEVDFIADHNSSVDIAFLPVTGCPSRWKKEFIAEGFFYSIDKLNPHKVYPMHAFNREYLLTDFAEMAKERNCKADIVCVENSGDQINYSVSNMAKK